MSSIGQSQNTSLPQQKQRIQAYADFNGFKIDKNIDEIESGGKPTREGLELLKSLVETGVVKRVIVLNLSRFSRDLYYGLKWLKYLNSHGVELISIQERIDDSISGRLMLQMLLGLSEFERSTIVSRMKSGKMKKFADGHRIGGTLAFGYGADGESLVLDSTHKRTIRYIFKSWIQMADMTKTMRMQTLLYELRRRNYRWKDGTHFTAQRVKYILKNPIYSGQLSVQNYGSVEHKYPSVISKKYFTRVQATFA